MFCQICKKHTQSGSLGCGHYEPHQTYAEAYKNGFKLYQYSGGLRTIGKRKLLYPIIFATKQEAMDYAWKMKNNLIVP